MGDAEREQPKVPRCVEIMTDSTYARGVLYQGWKASKNPELVARIKDKLLARTNAGSRVRIHWVKAHNGLPGNERADQLANRGVAESIAQGAVSSRGSHGSGSKRKRQ